MVPVYDLKIPRQWVEEDIAHGIEGRWRWRKIIDVMLHTHRYDGFAGVGYFIENGVERFTTDFRWNGSNVVIDSEKGLPCSAFHDSVCEFIDRHYSGWQRIKLRWCADRDYGKFLIWQGKNKLIAWNRVFWLHARLFLWPFKRLPFVNNITGQPE